MPHTTVTYTRDLVGLGAVNWAEFAPALQSVIVSVADASPQACRTRFVAPQDEWYVAGDRPDTRQAVHVEIALKAGRSAEVRGELARAVLALLRERLAPTPRFTVHLSVEVREMDPVGYASHVEPRVQVADGADVRGVG